MLVPGIESFLPTVGYLLSLSFHEANPERKLRIHAPGSPALSGDVARPG